jgi:nickel-dependent lactate racemase
MTEIQLGYGQRALPFSFDPNRLHSLTLDSLSQLPLSDVDIGAALDSPIASPPLDELIQTEDSVLIVVSDATRPRVARR